MKVKSLDKKWKEILYAFAGFGPNLLMVLMGAYFTDAINPAALSANAGTFQVINGTCLILPVLFPIIWFLAKAFDGIIDIPLASISDNYQSKRGKRRPLILMFFLPMVISFTLCWLPLFKNPNETQALINTVWICFWAFVFFASYTMCLIVYYGSLSNVCDSEGQRLRVSSYKAFADTISYCLVYALVPLICDALKLHIDKFVFICLPLMLTMLIPIFLIKEGEKYGYPEKEGLKEEKVPLFKSLKLTFGNKLFRRWLIVNCCSFFGLQMFLVSMNALIIGGMGFNGLEMALLNTCAFAPVPVMLYLFNKIKAKKGLRLAIQISMIAFAVAILSFDLASIYVTGGNKIVQYIIGCAGGVMASFSIGSFFMVPYVVPAQISSVEEKLTGVNHSAMYFAAQAFTTSIIGAIASSLVYENIKMLFIQKGTWNIVWAKSLSGAATSLGVAESAVFNLGTLLVPIIVSIFCIIGFIAACKMPKDFSAPLVAQELKKMNPDLDISSIETIKEEKSSDNIFVNIVISILSGFIFGFIWQGFVMAGLDRSQFKVKIWLNYLLCALVPFYSVFFLNKALHKDGELTKKEKVLKVITIISAVICPILPLNLIGLSVLQKKANSQQEVNNG